MAHPAATYCLKFHPSPDLCQMSFCASSHTSCMTLSSTAALLAPVCDASHCLNYSYRLLMLIIQTIGDHLSYSTVGEDYSKGVILLVLPKFGSVQFRPL